MTTHQDTPTSRGYMRLVRDICALYRTRLSVLVLLTIVGFSSVAIMHHLFGKALSDIFIQVDASGAIAEDRLLWWVGVILGCAAVRGTVLYVTAFFRVMTIQRIVHYVRSRLFTSIQGMELDWHHKHGTGELVTRSTRDCDILRQALESTFQVCEIIAMLVGSLILLYSYHWQLAVPPTALLVLAVWMYVRQAQTLVLLNRVTDDAYDAVTQDLSEGIEGVRVVKAFALEKARTALFAQHVHTFVAHGLRALTYATTRIPLPQLIISLTHPWILYCGIILIAESQRTSYGDVFDVGYLVAALMALTNIIFRLDGMGAAMRVISDAVASLQRLSEVVYAESSMKGGAVQIPASTMQSLSLTHVRVNGDADVDGESHVLLSDVTCTINAGEIVALVGATGSGKSVLCSLLPALKAYDAGHITVHMVDGTTHALEDIEHSQLRAAIHVVPQEAFLFSDTIAGNLTLACSAVDEAALWTALDDAGIKEFVEQLPDGLQSRLGERGMTVSGGQKQRLCLARALLSAPQLLVLDDSTSALDSVTEQRIFERLRAVRHASAVLLVTTRLSSVLLADRVLMLADGCIVADGTHHELAQHHRLYQELLCLPTNEQEDALDD